MMLENVIESKEFEMSRLKTSPEKCDVNDKVVSNVETQNLQSLINTVQKSFNSISFSEKSFKCEEFDCTVNTKEDMKIHV